MGNKSIQKFFADQNSVIDLSSLGNAKGAKVSLSGPDMNITTPRGSVIIVNGALYSSIKGNNLAVKFKDKTITGAKILGSVDLKDIQLERIDSSLVDSAQVEKKGNGKRRNKKEEEELKKQLDDAENAKKEADKAKEEAEKAKEAAEKALNEAFEVQNSSKQIEEMLQNFLADNVAKDNLAQQSDASQQNTQAKATQASKQNDAEKVLPQPINKNTSTGKSNSSKNEENKLDAESVKEPLKVTLALAAESNSGSKDDSITNFTKPQFVGSTAPNATVIIKINGIAVGQAVADSLGNFTFTAPETLTDGTYNLEAEAKTADGSGSAKLVITIDSVTDKPTFELSPESSVSGHKGLTPTLTPSIVGTAEENAKVDIYVDNKLVASVDVDKDGNWSYEFKDNELSEGENSIKVVAVDKAGNKNETTDSIITDTIPPEKPTIELDDSSDSGIKNDNITNSTLPTFIGVAEPGSTVSIYLGLKHLGEVIVAKDGTWSYTLTTPLKDGEYNITATATDIAGHTSATANLPFTIDTRISYFSAEIETTNDSGIVGDNVTNNTRPTFTGKTEPNAIISVINSETGEEVIFKANDKGEWTFNFTSDSVEGINNLTFTVEDVAGNKKDFSFSYVIDTIAPVPPTVSLEDFVVLPNGIILSGNDLPALVGTAEPKSTILLMRDGKLYDSIEVDSNGTWNYQFSNKFLQGAYDIEIISQDAAGNKSSTVKYSFTIQTEVVPPKAELDASDDSGAKGDWITNKHNALTLLGTADRFATVNILIDGKTIGVTTADADGNWNFDISRNLSDNVYKITVESIDPLGRTSSVDYQLTIDSFTPIPTVMLHDSADSGVKGDMITKINTPLFTGMAEANAKVSIYVDGVLSGEAIAGDDGVWNFQFTTALSDGSHDVTVKVEDIAGNTASSSAYNFQIVTQTQKPTIELVNDTGVDNTDHIINEKNPALTGTAAPYSTVKLYIDGALIAEVRTNKDGRWEYTLKADQGLVDGDHRITASVEDIAGNIAHSDPFLISVDTAISIPIVSLSPDSDSGISDDNLTNIVKPTLHLKDIDPDIISVQVWDAMSDTQIGVATQQPDGSWAYTFTSDLTEGLHQVYVKVEDIAGNKANSAVFDFTIDTTVSTPVISLLSKDDTGVTGDNLTNINKPGFAISGVDADAHRVVVQVMHNGVSEEIELSHLNGSWLFTPGNTWTDGSYTLTVKVEDKAGNTNYSTPLTVVIDTQIAIDGVELVNDSGVKGDNMTNDDRPHFRVTVPTDVNEVRLSIDGGNSWVQATPGVAGSWEYIWPTDLADGQYTLTVEATDKAGNTVTKTIDFAVDTTLSVPVIVLDSADDTGIQGDNMTNSTQPTFALQHIDDDAVRVTVSVEHGGVTTTFDATKGTGGWSFTPTGAWADGDYTLSVSVEDKAGNTSHSASLTVTVDTQIAINNIELVNDSGIPNDNLTNNVRPHFQVTVPTDVNVVRLSIDGGKTWFNATQSATPGAWDYIWPDDVADGGYTLTVEATDKAGNKTTQELDFTIDTTLSVPTLSLDSADDSGIAGDNITNVKTPGFTLNNIDTDVSRVIVEVMHNGIKQEVPLVQTGGQWRFAPTSDWADGDYILTVKVEDRAGNVKQSAPLTVTVDTHIAIDRIELVNDSGIPDDNLTNEARPHFQVTVPADVNGVRLSIDGGKTWFDATQSATSGVWDYTWLTNVANGPHTLMVEASDKAGNKTTQKLDFTIDTILSEPTITLDSADDSAAGDNITNVKMPGFTLGNIDADVTKVVVTVAHDGKNQQIELIKNGGVWRFTPGAAWTDGDYTLTVKVEDKAGNTNYSAPLTVTIDTQTSIDRIELLNDTGIVGDNLTNEARPQFHITVPTDVNSVQLSLDGGINWVNATLTSDGVWEYIWPTDLVENTYTLTVKATDVAGNTATETLNFIIDTTLSTPTITLDSADDSGTANDNKTNIKTPGFIIGGIDSDVTQVVVQVMRDGHSEEVELTQTNGQWRFVPGSAWTDGDYTLTVTVKDEAGNIRHSAPLTVTIDTQIAIDHIELVNDSGIPNDNLTNEARPHFQVTVPTDVNVVRLSIDGGKTWFNATQSATPGVWDYTWLADVGEGKHTLTVEATDKAGNKTTQQLDFIIDTLLSEPTIVLDSTDDSGTKGDNLTNVNKPTFLLGNIDADARYVTVEVQHGGTKEVLTATKDATGNWSVTPTGTWADGDYTLTVRVEDEAGNEKHSASLTVTVDTQITIDVIELVNDNGIPGDNMTNDAHPQFRVTVPGDVNEVSLSIDGGVTWVKATQSATPGVWNYTWPGTVPDGDYTLNVKATDNAGNTVTETLHFTIDTTLSTPVIVLDSADDTGIQGDNMTNSTQPTFNLQHIDDDAVRVTVSVEHGGVTTTFDATKGTGGWTFTPPTSWGAGDYTLSVSVEDKAGNTSHSASLTVTVDTQIAINNIELVNDSGIPDDNLTNNVRPHFQVKVPTDVNEVRLSIDGGKTWFNATQSATPGVWDYTWLADVGEGKHTLTVEATDKAGNQTTQKLDFIIDTLLSEPTIVLDSTDDSGTKGDNLTNANKPTFLLGNIDADARYVTVEVQHGGTKEVLTATKGATGIWSVTPTGTWADGDYTLTVRVEDEAGNVKYSAPLTVTVDTQITIDVIELVNDNGIPGDNLTNDVRPHFRVTVPGDVNEVRLSIDGGNTWVRATQGTAGTWDYTWPKDVTDGLHTLTVEATDKAGNKTTQTLDFTIDTRLSTPTIAMDSRDDTGAIGDHITSVKRPGFTIGNIDSDAQSVILRITQGGNSQEVTLTQVGGQWRFTPDADWADGSYTLTVEVTDNAGNVRQSTPLIVTVDTQTSITDITLVNDHGVPDDNLTNSTRPQFEITVPADVNSVQLSIDGGANWVSAAQGIEGVWGYTWPTDMGDGKHILTVMVTDRAGNTATQTLEFFIDTRLSTPTIALDSTDDTGTPGDDMTNRTRPTFILQNIDSDVINVTVSVTHNGTTTSFTATQGAGGWSFTPPAPWGDGDYTLTVTVEDRAGNTRPSTPLTVTVDTQIAIDHIELVNDSGVPGDNVTKHVRPQFQISVPDDVEKVLLSIDGGTTWVTAIKSSTAGIWDYTWPTDMPEGQHTLIVEVTDGAGNKMTGTLDFTIDITLLTPTIELAPDQDTGQNKNDNLTSVTQPVFVLGSIDKDVRHVELSIEHNGTFKTVVLTESADGWRYRPDSALADGSYTFTVTVTDVAGNQQTSAPLKVTIDGTLTTPVIELAAGEDSGTVGDRLTNHDRPVFDIRQVDSDVTRVMVKVTYNGKTHEEAAVFTNGQWRFTPSASWADGSYQLAVVVEDLAGNVKESAPFEVRIDTTTTINNIVLLNDTGVQNDQLTNVAKPSFRIDVPGDVVQVRVTLDGGANWNVIRKNADGQWIFDSPNTLVDGTYTLRVEATDEAGNIANKDLVFNIDTNIQVPTIALDAGQDTGANTADNITNISRPTFTIGNVDPDVIKVVVTIDGHDYNATKVGAGWQFTPGNAIPDGSYNITVTVEDKAGNTATSKPLPVVIDTTAEIESVTLVTDSGDSDVDNITKVDKPQFSIVTADDITHVRVKIDNAANWIELTKGGDGRWIFNVGSALPDGKHTLLVDVTDIAGNVAQETLQFTIDTTLREPTIVLDPTHDTGDDTNDNLTRINKPVFIIGNVDNDVSHIVVHIDGRDYTIENTGGNLTFTPDQPLSDGQHTISVTVTDIAGNTKTSAELQIEIDTQVQIDSVTLTTDSGVNDHDNVTNATRPSFEIATPDDVTSVLVSFDGVNWTPISKNAAGQWEFTAGSALPDGHYTLHVQATDRAGNTANSTLGFTVDTQIDGLSVVMLDDAGKDSTDGITNITSPRFEISAREPLQSVTVILNGKSSTLTQGAGNKWLFTPDTPLVDGTYKIEVVAEDIAGNKISKEVSFTIDTIVSDPSIDLLDADDTGESAVDNITSVTKPRFVIGNVPADIDTVVIRINGVSYPVTANGNNLWEFQVPVALNDGVYEAVVVFRDIAGNTSETKLPFTIDTTTSVSVRMEPASDTGNSNSDNLTNKQNPKFEGTAEPNAKLVITIVDDKSGREVLKHTITVGADGNWSVTPNILPDGMYTINVVATDVAGNTAQTQERFTIDTVTIDPTIRLSDPSIDDQHEATSLRPEFKGFAEAFSTIMIQWDGKVVGSANANANGEWSWTPPSVLAPGSYVVSIVAKDKAGNESSQVDFPVVIPVIDVTPPTIKLSEESDSGALGDFTTNNKTPTLIGSTLPNTIVSIYVDGVKVGEATADTAGRYTFQLSEMKDGHYVVQVGIVNPRDNSELRSTAVDVTIDTEVAELVWNISGMHEGGYINTVTPEIGGTSEPNSKITIFVNGVEKAIAYTTGAGHWGVVLPALGNDGNYVLTFKVEDVAGNIREFGPQNVILDTVISPLTVVLREADDSGKVGDWITNKSHVTIDGTAEAGSTLTIRNPQGVVIATLVVGNDGRWSAELDLREGSNAFVVVSEDKAGNSQQKDILIEHDTQIEISDISLSRDTNSGDKYDLITNNKSPVLVAMTDPGATVQVYINGVLQGTVEASSSGNISYTMPANSADGEYQVQFVATDTAGNRVESAITTVTIDSQIAVFDIDEDSLPALSNNRALSVSGVGEAGSQVSIFVDGKLVNVVMVEADGTWRAPILLQDDGTFNIHFSITDVAGNTEVSKDYSVDVDSSTDFPTLNLEDASNSGSLDDLITSHNKPVLVGTAEAGATIHIYVDEKIVANVLVLEDGTWSYQFDNALKDGEYSIRVVAEDPAGNTAESPRLLVTIDTSTFIDNPAMVAGSDNGIFSNDSITSQTRPTFSIFGEMNQSVQIFIDGVLVDTITVTDRNQVYRPESPLGDGSHSIYYVITDKAGNTATSKTLNFTIDTFNTTPVAIDSIGGQTLAEMTGSDGKIYITDTTRNLLFSGSAEPNSKIEIIINGLNVGEVWANDKGHWQMPVNPLYFTEGQLDINVKSTDRAGNVNQEKYSIWVDTHIQVFTSELDDNKSSSKTDWWSNSSTITMRGMGEIGATVSLIVAGVTLATAVVAANGKWELSTDQLPEGKYDITLSIEDNAGNRKEEVHEIFIDRTPPNAPVVTYSDIVNDLIIMQGTAEAKSQLIITDSNGNTYTLTVPDNGKWSMAIPYPSEGKFTITSVDAIGNRSDDVPLDIMKEVPVISLSPDSDSGTVGDNITRDKQPTFIIGNLESDVVVVQVDINGTVYNAEKNADGVWFFTPGTPLADGSYTISVIASDAAGNQKNSLPITVTIDSTLTVPEIALAAGEDNGASDSDNVTNHTQPKFTLQHIDADVTGVTVNVTHNGVTDTYQATQGADGWTFTPPAAWNDGTYTLSVTVVDRAGNSQQSALLEVTVDSTLTVPEIALAAGEDNGASDSDNVTNHTQPKFTLQHIDADVTGATVNVTHNGVTDTYQATQGADDWTFTPPAAWNDGTYTLSVTVVDRAGNSQQSALLEVTVDSTLTVPEIALAAGEDNGASDSDNVTNHTQPKFTLQHIDADVTGATVNVTHNGVTDTYQATQGADDWTFTPPAAWNDGTYTLSVTVVDRAGNSQQSASLAVTVDSTVTVTADSQHNDASDDATAIAVTPPESETVNAESATHLRTVPSAAEESVVKETAYSITLLNADSGDEIDRSISQTPSFEISVPENIVNVSVMFEGEEFTLPITNQKAIFEVPLSLEDGEYTMDVKFIDKDDDFLIKEKTFSVDHSSADIVNAMNARGKTEDDINDSPSTSSVGHNNNGAIDVFAVNEVTLPVDNQEEHA
ncbi:Ig-like domain repeat protein [Salmonella enterica subsp. enterica serovar Goldcoast]|uniref:Ig-like domain repeat protein n=11 Tax=Salmonella TaxID=590 RepID=A0A6D2CJI3_SALET|nr:non-fimbrial adhesin SiiE [Salmonella sp. 32040203-2019-00159]QBO70847.1 Ig-like domain repeat protein [Salmonella enterica subsp. enterica serovar Goldcoast]UNE00436.1 non-fimbrial adhesin SiiE [Salmonella enterica]WMP90048.1 non-fimbrial adhesin SiiE [Salmonella enterica subsp. enterica]QCZ61357.1 Ig-like domain repeat protein [Salmonella enterica subsp. enterica serovar Goldcoast]